MDNKQHSLPTCCAKGRHIITKNKHTNINVDITSKKTEFTNKLVYLPGGEFLMGTEDKEGFHSDHEGPVKKVKVEPFYIDKTTVTNEEFKTFVDDTSYVTDAEKYGWSFVFFKFLTKKQIIESQRLSSTPWWYAVSKAYWYQPEGEGSNITDRLNHPVIHVSWNDAKAFAKWAGKRLPSEKEWEYAARGGLVQKKYPWGDELIPNGEHQCNIWQGQFPNENTLDDGYLGTAPVDTYSVNGYGLYNMAGNVWEWCADWFDKSINMLAKVDLQAPKVMRGGSYLCHHSYCNRYRVGARSSNTIESSTGNLGFRCVMDVTR